MRYHLDYVLMIKPGEDLGLLLKIGLNFGLGLLGLVRIRLYDFECDHVSNMVVPFLSPRIRCQKHSRRQALPKYDLVPARLQQEPAVYELFLVGRLFEHI